jgi:aryl-alcohol dehydrogenase-like predicted oxidoreductase
MKFETLGKTNEKVSVVGLGTWQFGGEWGVDFSATQVDSIFNAARDCGINLIDTAECYGDHLSESLIGAAIESDRDNWFLATKFGHHFESNFTRSEPRSGSDVVKQLEDSLSALRTDRIDLYQYHSWGDDEVFAEDVQAVLLKAKDDGKIRFLGNSVRAKGDSSIQVSQSTKHQIDTIQIVYNRLAREPEAKSFPICEEQNLGVLARVPLASGYLSGKYKPGHQFDEKEVRGKYHQISDRDKWLAEVEGIKANEVPDGVDMAQWAIAWCLKHPAVTCVIPGVKNAEQVRSNAAASELSFE